jgi:hypothetical protein
MAESQDISMDEFRVLVKRAGLELTDDELESLKPKYDHHAGQTALLHDIDLKAEDMAVSFSPDWDPEE